MTRLFLILLLIFAHFNLIAQKFQFYTPTGKALGKIEETSINEINKKINVRFVHDEYFSDGHMVGFLMLSKKAVWIFTDNPKKIDSLTRLFDYDNYLDTWKLEFDLEKMIKAKVLTDSYLIYTIGKPDKKIRSSNGVESSEKWFYNDLNLMLDIENSKVIKYIRIN